MRRQHWMIPLWFGLWLGLWSAPSEAENCDPSVRATTPTTDFVLDDALGLATHAPTGLIWQRCLLGQTWDSGARSCTGNPPAYSWKAALQAARDDAYAGHQDWRVPNISELRSIVESRCRAPSLNETVFPGDLGYWLWSSSPDATYPNYAWLVGFDDDGHINIGDKANSSQVRLVRSGLSFDDFGTQPPLTAGVPVANLSGAAGRFQYFRIEVPAGATNLQITTASGTGDVDLYVQPGNPPTLSAYECRSVQSGNEEICLFPTPTAGTYYLLLYGNAAFSGVTLTGSYDADEPCPYEDHVTLQNVTESGAATYIACRTITAGPAYLVTATGHVTLRAGERITLQPGFRVQTGGRLRATTGLFIEPEMVTIPGGAFLMGSPESEWGRDSSEQQHSVTVASFAIGKYEVTFDEYDRFADATGRERPDDGGWGRGRRPVINVTWHDATAYAAWLSQQTGRTYRLPTEAEWEYAARAGTTTPFWTGNCVTTAQANYNGLSAYGEPDCGAQTGGYRDQTLEVGSFPANPWGLHDTTGNVWEWTCSLYDASYSGQELVCNNNVIDSRTFRGGSWGDGPNRVRSATRFRRIPSDRYDILGFRLARSL